MTTVEAPLGVAPVVTRAGSRVWRWPPVALAAIALLAAGLNLWGLQRAGYGNAYYAAAVLSMLQNWHNFFFVSFDPGGFVSIDKPPPGCWASQAWLSCCPRRWRGSARSCWSTTWSGVPSAPAPACSPR